MTCWGASRTSRIEKLDIEALGARDAEFARILSRAIWRSLLECLTYDSSGQAIEHAKSFNRGDAGGYTYNY